MLALTLTSSEIEAGPLGCAQLVDADEHLPQQNHFTGEAPVTSRLRATWFQHSSGDAATIGRSGSSLANPPPPTRPEISAASALRGAVGRGEDGSHPAPRPDTPASVRLGLLGWAGSGPGCREQPAPRLDGEDGAAVVARRDLALVVAHALLPRPPPVTGPARRAEPGQARPGPAA